MFSHGLRVSEVLHLTRDNFTDGFLTVQRLKGSLRTVQPLIESDEPLFNEKKAVLDYVGNQLGTQRLFPITRQHAWRLMQRYCLAAGIPKHKAHPHALKHSIALMLVGLIHVGELQKYLGHKSGSSTLEYTKVSDADAARAVRGALGILKT
jgi:integrase/recombinase XerD